MINTIVILIMAHFAVDYQFQSESVALGKNRSIDKAQYGVNWYYWMLSHSSTHGLCVFFITGSVLAGLCETFLHFMIDAGKCQGEYGLHVDQWLHLTSKVFLAWIVLV